MMIYDILLPANLIISYTLTGLSTNIRSETNVAMHGAFIGVNEAKRKSVQHQDG